MTASRIEQDGRQTWTTNELSDGCIITAYIHADEGFLVLRQDGGWSTLKVTLDIAEKPDPNDERLWSALHKLFDKEERRRDVKQYRRRHIPFEDAYGVVDPYKGLHGKNPFDSLHDAHILLDCIRKARASLKDELAIHCFVEHNINGISFRKLASKLGISHGTAYLLDKKVKQKLRSLLVEQGF
jgi:hypothetical protein